MIKQILMFCAALAVLSSCGNNANSSDSTTAAANATEQNVEAPAAVAEEATQAKGVIEYTDAVFDFGTIKDGDIVDHVFAFKNTGTEPVILTQVAASCGCTTPDYTKTPILPGESGEIKVSYNSAGQVGVQQKIVTVNSNAENAVTTVQLKGTVLQK